MKLRGLIWWIDRWRQSASYQDLTLEEQGAYRNLLDEAWLRGGTLPANDRVLARASGDPTRWKTVKKRVLKRFKKCRNGWHHDTLDQVLHTTQLRAERQRRFRAKNVTRSITDGITRVRSGSGS